jgi:hypothetical protein
MQKIKLSILMGFLALGFIACNEVDKAKTAVEQASTKATDNVQKVINDLGLVYVEEGAQNIITYDEVNAAQQAWCDALVQIGKLKTEGGDYKAYAEKVLSEAYNYDNGKVFFKPTLTFGDQTFRNDKKGAVADVVGGGGAVCANDDSAIKEINNENKSLNLSMRHDI